MAPRSPSQRPACTPRPSLNERLLAARTEPTIGKSKTRAAKEHSAAASKKRRTGLRASKAVEKPEETTTVQPDEEEHGTDDAAVEAYKIDDVSDHEAAHEPEDTLVSQSDNEESSADEDHLFPEPAEPVLQPRLRHR